MPPVGYQVHHSSAPEAAEVATTVAAVATIFSNSFGVNPKTQGPYRMGPKKTRERLQGTDHLFLAIQAAPEIPVGYLYGRRIEYEKGSVVWIDSLAVLPDHRRKGVGTWLVRSLLDQLSDCGWVGCATPNPVAALVIARASGGTAYAGECDPPPALIRMINSIRGRTPDLQGAEFNPRRLLVRTSFNPVSTGDSKEWTPPQPTEPPPWWASLANLPSEHEALVIIDRHPQP
jgi:GNAT superfamily N-acetyltransferase